MDRNLLSKATAGLLKRTDWYLWESVSPQDAEAVAEHLAEYVLGGEDDEFCYTGDGREQRDSPSHFLSCHELDIRCPAMSYPMPPDLRKAAALLYFRYCFDHNEFMELSQQLRLATLPEQSEQERNALLLEWLTAMYTLEQVYTAGLYSHKA